MPSGARSDRRGSESVLYENGPASTHPNSRRKASLADIYDSRPGTPAAPPPPTQRYQGQPNDGASAASGSTILPDRTRTSDRQRSDSDEKDDDSGGTARADQWATEIRQMFGNQPDGREDGGTLRANQPVGDSEATEEPEETLWFVPPSAGTVVRSEPHSPTKPSLQLNTASQPSDDRQPDSASSATDSDLSAAISAAGLHDGISKGLRVQRTKSFARTKDQWNERPNPELVYDHLEEFFPKIDLDRPVLPAAPAQLSVIDATSPRTESPEPIVHGHLPSVAKAKSQFNRAENRKSIRIVAEDRKRHLSRIAPAVNPAATSLERKRSSSMWGHKTIEVTPAKMKRGQVPGVSGEAVLPDGKPGEFRKCALF
jgi:mitogen-activated protein kinase kinase kinase